MLYRFMFLLLIILGSNQLIAQEKITFYHYDLLGSPIVTTDEQGNVIWREEYEPWGKKRLNDDASHDNVRDYTGHVYDKDTQLTYMQARYYDAEIGRFMGIDPVGFREDNPISFNRYAYANNNPYKFVDPNGEDAKITYNKDKSISIELPIEFEGGTKSEIEGIKDNISFAWTGKYTIGGKKRLFRNFRGEILI